MISLYEFCVVRQTLEIFEPSERVTAAKAKLEELILFIIESAEVRRLTPFDLAKEAHERRHTAKPSP